MDFVLRDPILYQKLVFKKFFWKKIVTFLHSLFSIINAKRGKDKLSQECHTRRYKLGQTYNLTDKLDSKLCLESKTEPSVAKAPNYIEGGTLQKNPILRGGDTAHTLLIGGTIGLVWKIGQVWKFQQKLHKRAVVNL